MNLLHIAALIAAIAFAIGFIVLVYYIATTLKSVRRTLHHTANTMEGFEKQMEGITKETELLLNKTNRLAEDITGKTEKVDVLFDGIKGIGYTVNQFNDSLQKLSDELQEQANEHAAQTSQTIKWGEAAIHLWKKYKDK
ncbi:DUF948 domain-containing protein [Alkalibacillus haloalkaliphilus]|uniref:DUF948 domain-containing protein n=1 Tax=Alkalibacillus haloalkaliphilus TaxID=94136 RepID=UPI0029358338|nr:DUF948 domain-containing protein [Alkalibacillus haloalkaliphilus]MDV2581252.1 DUF948 domain-containing protein [Alkalibacillus haloalkaliphilus]